MKKVCVLGLIGFLFSLGLHSSTFAIVDPTGDNIGPLDLSYDTNAVIYDRSWPSNTDALLKLSINSTPNLPGVIIFECDVDNSTGTGGSISMLGTPIAPCPCKTTAGFDIVITLFLRQQGDDSGSAICGSCSDNQGPCGKGIKRGQWYATTSVSGQPIRNIGILSGYLDPLPLDQDSYLNSDCYTLPWSHILWYANQELQGVPKKFNNQKAQDFSNYKWQISIWYDPDFSDQDDITDGSSGPLNVSDWIPNGDGSKADIEVSSGPTDLTFCEGNFDLDATVDGGDAAIFKANFGRSQWKNPCPRCGPNY